MSRVPLDRGMTKVYCEQGCNSPSFLKSGSQVGVCAMTILDREGLEREEIVWIVTFYTLQFYADAPDALRCQPERLLTDHS